MIVEVHNDCSTVTAKDFSDAPTDSGDKIRFIRLVRRHNVSYGFHLRGGSEHGTGFFISHVEPNSEAFLQGLRAGDQLLRVNQLSVDQALHKEVAALVQSQDSVLLTVKSTGLIPVKEKRGDPLTWMMVEDDVSEERSSVTSPGDGQEADNDTPPFVLPEGTTRITISCSSKNTIGCSICKGPQEKPGIYIQSVKAGGTAKKAGLKAGDQIIGCNDVSFVDIEFSEAVKVLKSSSRLILDVIRGAGLDLVAGESSGYNSSSSSVAGDQTPPPQSTSTSSDADSISRKSGDPVTNRLYAVSRHLLDRNRDWSEIEAEWAIAEKRMKRSQPLQRSVKNKQHRPQKLLQSTRAPRMTNSQSMTCLYLPHPQVSEKKLHKNQGGVITKVPLRGTLSNQDLRGSGSNHKIALITSDPHVNNIVVSGTTQDATVNEKDALSRLDQLSLASSKSSSLSSHYGRSYVRLTPSHSTSLELSSDLSDVDRELLKLKEEKKRLKEETDKLAEERKKFEEERRRLLRTHSVPLSPLVISCSSPHSPLPSPSSARHTTKVTIKSPAPAPPPRDISTTLTLPKKTSPPSSPAASTSSSSGVASWSGGYPYRCKSIGSLSASSNESGPWEDMSFMESSDYKDALSRLDEATASPPKAPPKPSFLRASKHPVGVPPPPPPPPSALSAQNGFASVVSKRMESKSSAQPQVTQRPSDSSREIKTCEVATKIEEKINVYKKEKLKPVDPKRAQHEQLMEEVQRAHKRMFSNKTFEEAFTKEHNNKTKEVSVSIHDPSINTKNICTTESNFTSKIIESSQKSDTKSTPKPIQLRPMNKPLIQVSKSISTELLACIEQRSICFNDTKHESQNEDKNLSFSKALSFQNILQGCPIPPPPPEPTVLKSTNTFVAEFGKNVAPNPAFAQREEFCIGEVSKQVLVPPKTYFNVQRPQPKSLVSIGTYSENQPSSPHKTEHFSAAILGGTHREELSQGKKLGLQDELPNSHKQVNVGSKVSVDEAPTSLSSKYSCMRSSGGSSVTINIKGNEADVEGDANCIQITGILKPVSNQVPSMSVSCRPHLQKTISFGGVTTVGEEKVSVSNN